MKITGKFGGGTYQVDRSDPANIVVKAKVFLKPAGTGTADDVKAIKGMEDGIEKAASMKGFLVDIDFVDPPDAETFTAESIGNTKALIGAWTLALLLTSEMSTWF